MPFTLFEALSILFALVCFAVVYYIFTRFIKSPKNAYLENCPVCAKEVASTANSCPHCGASLRLHPVLRFFIKLALWVIIILLSIFGFIFLKMFFRAIF